MEETTVTPVATQGTLTVVQQEADMYRVGFLGKETQVEFYDAVSQEVVIVSVAAIFRALKRLSESDTERI